jgi:hypothetical protein
VGRSNGIGNMGGRVVFSGGSSSLKTGCTTCPALEEHPVGERAIPCAPGGSK